MEKDPLLFCAIDLLPFNLVATVGGLKGVREKERKPRNLLLLLLPPCISEG